MSKDSIKEVGALVCSETYKQEGFTAMVDVVIERLSIEPLSHAGCRQAIYLCGAFAILECGGQKEMEEYIRLVHAGWPSMDAAQKDSELEHIAVAMFSQMMTDAQTMAASLAVMIYPQIKVIDHRTHDNDFLAATTSGVVH